MKQPILLLICTLLAVNVRAQRHASTDTNGVQPATDANATNPVAHPEAFVVLGKAPFTVLTSQLIRMEWAKDGKLEDHASLVFLNLGLP
jgi:hypothetical protein